MSLYQISSSRSNRIEASEQDLAQTMKAAPLLLKPNGAPVFQNVGPNEIGVTMKRAQETAELERTVKAHSFVVGKKIQNSTDIQKSAAQEHSFPVKVLYVKPGIVKQEKRKASQPVVPTGIPGKEKDINVLDLDVSMGEISGIFKKAKKRVQSAPQKEAEKRLKAQKEYAEQVKLQNKIKEEQRQRTLAERGKSGEAPIEAPKLELTKPKLPHSQNRYQGKFDSMTKELFKKAQEKLREEQNKTKSTKDDQKAKKEREAMIQEEVKLINREKVMRQKESGNNPMTLKQKEEARKYDQQQKENNEMRQKRREQTEKSREDRGRQLAFHNISQKKLAEHQQRKLQEKFELQEYERIQEIVNRQDAMIRMAALNKDIIDFSDPTIGMPSPPQDQEEVEQPDEEAQLIQKREARQRALVETRQKRKNQELMKKMAEDQEKQKKEQMMADLEDRLMQQREEFSRKQKMAQEKSVKDANKRVKESKKSSRGNTKDRSNQLNELRDWIDEQMNIEDVKTTKDDTIKPQPKIIEPPQDPALLKYQLPGNSLLDLEDERRISVRQNRYGIDGDNGYDEIVGFLKKPADSILDFVQKDNQQYEEKSDDSYDVKPVKQEKRKILNQPVEDPIKFPPPGMLNLKQEADRQKKELLKKQGEAATVMQKWARGWEARKRAQKLRYRTRKDIDQGYTDYTENFKINDKFNLNRFINEKQRLRQKYGTDAIDDDSISEQIGEASVDIQTESYIRSQILGSSSRPAAAIQNFFLAPIKKNMEYDPLSLIMLYAQRNTVAASPEQLIPEKEKPHKPRAKSGAVVAKVQPAKQVAVQHKRSKSSKQQTKKWDDEISEDIIQSSKAEEQYSENFASDDHITESIPSLSVVVQSGDYKKDSAKISESIPEESGIQSSIPEEDIPEDVIESKEDIISEDSYLRNSASSEIKESIAGSGAKVTKVAPPPPPPKKIDRIRDKIKEDFENNGQETFKSVYKVQEIKQQQEDAEKERNRQYRLSKQIIQDYEENKNAGSDAHKLIMKDLTEELNRYEAAVSNSIFVEQFQGIVQKNLAQKDIMMLGQRLSQLEQENKHKQEIADIRAEQIRMMSQLMLLNAGGQNLDKKSSESLRLQQEQIMGNIQKLIEKPIIIEQVGLNQEIIESIKESVQMNERFRASISQSKAKESIQDEAIESDIQESVVDESIQESIQLSNARRVLGSEQTLIQKSKEMLSDKKKNGGRAPSPFEKNSFQNYTSDKFKDLLFNDGSMMDEFLDQIEIAVAKKSENEKKQLKKQLEMKKISPRAYSKKAKDLEKWVIGERAEINQKRKKVKDTCQEIGVFMKKIEQDKQLIMDSGLESGRSTPRKFGQSQNSISTSAMGLRQIQDQLEDIRSGTIGGNRPETKYINKKRDFVRQLMIEKKEAIDKGVKDRMKDMESDMVDEMMQAALSLDVEEEIEKRIALAKQMVEEGRIDESASKSIKSEKKYKKNVKFQQPSPKGDKYSSSGSFNQQVESSLRSRSNKIEASVGQDDMIGESIAMEESLGQSSTKKSKVDSSGKYSASAGKSKNSEKIQELDENSLSRDEDEIEDDVYSNDFASRSIQSATVSSKKNKLTSSAKNIDVEESGYSEAFDDQSMGQSWSQSKGLKNMTNIEVQDIEIVDEEDDSNQEEATSSKPSPEQSGNMEPSFSDREIIESNRSVQWEFQLQDRKQVELPAPEPEYPSEEEEELEEEPTEQNISEEYDVQADDMQDLESNPTGSLQNSYPKEEDDIEKQADQITEELLREILQDFQNDTKVKMVVEDDIDEDEFEDKWPYTLDKKVEEPEKPMTPALSQAQPVVPDEKPENDIAKKRHDILMKKYHAEQAMINQGHMKTKEYLEFITQIVDKEVLQQNLQRPIEHDPLKILEKIQAFDTEDEIEMTNLTNSQQQSALPSYLFDEIQKRYEEIHTNEKKSNDDASQEENPVNVSQEAKQVHHLAIFDAFNESLDLERPYKFKGLPNPWSKQTRITNETLSSAQVDQIVQKAMERVIGWDASGAGTKYAPAPTPPPLQQDYDAPYKPKLSDEERKAQEKQEEDERNKAERSERLGILLTKEVHQRENDWLDYEIEDTQVRFDLADMILEELADEVTQFLIIKQKPNIEVSGGSSNSYDDL